MGKQSFVRRLGVAVFVLGMAGGMPLVGVDLGVPLAIAAQPVAIPPNVAKILAGLNAASLTPLQRANIARDVMAAVLALPGPQQAAVLQAAVAQVANNGANVVGTTTPVGSANATAFNSAVAALPPAQQTAAGTAVGNGVGQAVVALASNPANVNAASALAQVGANSTVPGVSSGLTNGVAVAIINAPNVSAAVTGIVAIAANAPAGSPLAATFATTLGTAIGEATVALVNNAQAIAQIQEALANAPAALVNVATATTVAPTVTTTATPISS